MSAPESPRSTSPSRLEDWLIVIVMTGLAGVTFANVLVRYFTDASFAWTEEISIFLMIVLAMVGCSAAVVRGSHIRIEFFADNGSPRRQRLLARFGALMVALLFISIAVLSVPMVWDHYQYEETSPGIGVPQWWYSVWLPILCTLIALRAVQVLVRKTREGGQA